MESGCCSTPRCRRRAAGCRLSCSSGSPPPEGLSAVLPVTQLPGRRCRQGLWRRWPSRGRAANPAPATSGRGHCSTVPRAHRSGAAARACGSGPAGAGGPVQQPAVDRPGGHPRPGPAALHPAQTPVATRLGPQRTAQPSKPASKVAMTVRLGCAGRVPLLHEHVPGVAKRSARASTHHRLLGHRQARRGLIGGGCSTAGSSAAGELVGSARAAVVLVAMSSRARRHPDRIHPRPRDRLRAPARRGSEEDSAGGVTMWRFRDRRLPSVDRSAVRRPQLFGSP